jgi:hypothetical protein
MSSPRAVTGGPVDRSAARGPGRNILAAGEYGPPDKSLTGRDGPWIRFSAHEAQKYKNPTEILIIFAVWKIIQFKLLIGSSGGNYINI